MIAASRIGHLLFTAHVNLVPGMFPPTASANLRIESFPALMDFIPRLFLAISPRRPLHVSI